MPRAQRHGLALALLALLAPAIARAMTDDCGKTARRWVAVRFSGPGFSPEQAESVLTDLRAEVVRHGIDACPAETSGLPPPIATLDIAATQPATLHLVLDIIDPATGAPSQRELQLDALPLDGHSLAVAVAADELLTSSWIKLASRPVPEAAAPAPPPRPASSMADTAAVAAKSVPGRHELGVLLAAERFDGAAWAEGLDLALRRWLLPRWALELAVGARTSVAQAAPHGQVRSRAMPLSLRMLVGLLPGSARARAGVAAALTAAPVFLSAVPDTDATARSQSALAVYLRGELWADVGWGRLRAFVGGGAGAPLRSVTADDTGVAIGGARGMELHGHVGVMLGL